MNVPEVDPDLPPILIAARIVASTSEETGETGYVRRFRQMDEKNPIQFMQVLKGLEKDWYDFKVQREEAKTAKKAEEDIGSAEAIRVVERLISDLTGSRVSGGDT